MTFPEFIQNDARVGTLNLPTVGTAELPLGQKDTGIPYTDVVKI